MSEPTTTPFKDGTNLVDLPEVSSSRRREPSLIPGLNDKYLYVGGIAVSAIIGLAALSQTPAVQNLIKRLTNRGGGSHNDQESEQEGIPIQVSQQSQQTHPQSQGFRVVAQDPVQQRQAQQVAQQLVQQEQLRQQQLQQVPTQPDASMYDTVVGGKDSNSIKAYRMNPSSRRGNYSSPFGASFSSS